MENQIIRQPSIEHTEPLNTKKKIHQASVCVAFRVIFVVDTTT